MTGVQTCALPIYSRFTLAILAAKRARQINDYMNNVKRQPLGEIRGPAFEMLSEKPLTIAFSEIGNGDRKSVV